jgi:hypothetical protein
MAYIKNNLIDYITHYYDRKAIPFRSLSSLSDEKAIKIMKSLYNEETEFSIRFKDPVQYLNNRRATEKWVRNEFIKKGGNPDEKHPIYTILGESKWLKKQKPKNIEEATIKLPLSIFQESDISFTYPDSMVSRWLAQSKPEKIYNKLYHGKIFLMSEILDIVNQKGIPEEDWNLNLPENMPTYIEGQVWNYKPIFEYIKGLDL